MKNDNNFDNTFRIALILIACIFMMYATIQNLSDISGLKQESIILKEQISTLKEQIFEIASKMPVNEFKESDNKLPLNEIKIETEQDDKVSRSAKSRIPIIMRVTAYDLSYESCKKYKDHPEYGIGASGKRVKEHHSIAAGPEIPFGTKAFIPAFKDKPNGGIFTVEDRGSAITENCLDVYLGESKYDECREFGIQYLEVYILEGVEYESR